MNKIRRTLVTCLCLTAFAVVSMWATKKQEARPQEQAVERISSNVEALQIVSVTELGEPGKVQRSYKIIVKNTSNKPIVEYTFHKKDGSALTTSGATTGWALAPNNTDAASVSLGEGDSLTLVAALFEDWRGQGNSQELARMRDYRTGVEKQYMRAAPMLRQAMNIPVLVKSPAWLAELQSQLSALPTPPIAGDISPGLAAGLYDAKQFIEVQVKPVKSDSHRDDAQLEIVHEKVGKTLDHIEKALKRFERKSAVRSLE